MSAPQRLLLSGATAFERELLLAWARRRPSAGAQAKTLALVGAAVAATVAGARNSVFGTNSGAVVSHR
jgi:hypothetical protein